MDADIIVINASHKRVVLLGDTWSSNIQYAEYYWIDWIVDDFEWNMVYSYSVIEKDSRSKVKK